MKHSKKAKANNPQIHINSIVEKAERNMSAELRWRDNPETVRLRSCSAWVYRTTNYHVLRSYNTIIACIDIRTGNGYDFLRMVYGYTSTSAQHISKFMHDYAAQKIYRWYAV